MAATASRLRERDALIQSLRSGVTPCTAARPIRVGRDAQAGALDRDLASIAEGGTSFRLIIGGGACASDKTFLLNLVRGAVVEQQLVVTRADLTPGGRLYQTPANSIKTEPHHTPETTPEHG